MVTSDYGWIKLKHNHLIASFFNCNKLIVLDIYWRFWLFLSEFLVLEMFYWNDGIIWRFFLLWTVVFHPSCHCTFHNCTCSALPSCSKKNFPSSVLEQWTLLTHFLGNKALHPKSFALTSFLDRKLDKSSTLSSSLQFFAQSFRYWCLDHRSAKISCIEKIVASIRSISNNSFWNLLT